VCDPIKCGDGQRESSGAVSEECDDGNTAGGDGCSAEVLRPAGLQPASCSSRRGLLFWNYSRCFRTLEENRIAACGGACVLVFFSNSPDVCARGAVQGRGGVHVHAWRRTRGLPRADWL
jgi:cysteine-rich repeat protein